MGGFTANPAAGSLTDPPNGGLETGAWNTGHGKGQGDGDEHGFISPDPHEEEMKLK
ncbi:MAG: hypothetical protein IPK15_14745 [Verrucomicrobia bacterium]|nr:hypothetical protein [Verrucomicrobiota bacterium]